MLPLLYRFMEKLEKKPHNFKTRIDPLQHLKSSIDLSNMTSNCWIREYPLYHKRPFAPFMIFASYCLFECV